MAVSMGSYRLKEAAEWSPVDVRDFLERILPGHPCVDQFTYTSGHVLCSLEKEDLRRQSRSEEATNVIWTELQACRGSASPSRASQARPERDAATDTSSLTIYVRTCRGVALELEVLPSDTVASLKEQIAEREGTPAHSQRLVYGGMCMQDGRSLFSYSIRHGAVMLLVPQLKEQTKIRPMSFAPRGLLMVPGNRTWQPASSDRPFLPVLFSDVSRNFPVSLEFSSTGDCEAFVAAARNEPPVLEVGPVRRGQPVAEARAHYDPDAGAVWLEGGVTAIAPSAQYEGVLHFGGRGGHVRVAVRTGAPA